MKSKTSGYEPAFPVSELPKQYQPKLEYGLSKREYFAAMALAGLFSDFTVEGAAEMAVKTADALIKELSKEIL